jgi:hypothetical protein
MLPNSRAAAQRGTAYGAAERPDLVRGLILLNPLVRNGSTSSAGALERRDGPVGCMNRGASP